MTKLGVYMDIKVRVPVSDDNPLIHDTEKLGEEAYDKVVATLKEQGIEVYDLDDVSVDDWSC